MIIFFNSSIESPPNFSRISLVRTHAIRASATTEQASTAQTSRAFKVLLLPAREFLNQYFFRGFFIVGIGFITAEITNSCPLVIPPSTPPA